MAPKSAPFKVVVHFTGRKSAAEIENLYADFYLEQVKRTLLSSNLSERGIKAVMKKLLAHYSQADLAA